MVPQIELTFSGLRGFANRVSVSISDNITTLVGPNGSGKSTVLEAIAEVLHFLDRQALVALYKDIQTDLSTIRTTNPDWSECEVIFRYREKSCFMERFESIVGTAYGDEFKVTLQLSKEEIGNVKFVVISSIKVGNASVGYERVDGILYRDLKVEVQTKIQTLTEEKREFEWLIGILHEGSTKLQSNQELVKRCVDKKKDKYVQKKDKYQSAINELENIKKMPEIHYANSNSDTIELDAVQEIIRKIEAAGVVYLHGHDSIDKYLDEMCVKFNSARNLPRHDRPGSSYQNYREQLEDFLNTDVDCSGDGKSFQLKIANKLVSELSVGTYLALSFYSLCETVDEHGIVLWDEPENSMHTTRRKRILSLMLKNSRRFVVATHQTEFAPVLEKNNAIYKLHSHFNVLDNSVVDHFSECKMQKCNSTLTDAYRILDSLGIEPSKVLFTANVIVWVEGPSDVIFWRDWIKKYTSENQIELLEGFDYTFLFSGGKLLAHQTIEDFAEDFDGDESDAVDSLVNVMTVNPTSVWIFDSDIKYDGIKSRIEKKQHKIESLLADLKGMNTVEEQARALLAKIDLGMEVSKYRPLFQKRVRNLIDAAAKIPDKNRVQLFSTWGTECENILTDASIHRTLRELYDLSESNIDDKSECAIIEDFKLDRWENLYPAIKTKVEAMPESNKLHIKGKPGEMAYKSKFTNKIGFANAYLEAHSDVSLKDILHDVGYVARLVEFISDVKKQYNM